MKTILTITFLLFTSSFFLIAQGPVTQLEGYLEVSPPLDNTSLYIGKDAGQKYNSPVGLAQNTFVGYFAGNLNSTGIRNSFFGAYAGIVNTSGSSNSLFGRYAGYSSTGSENAFFGTGAGYHATGSRNSFIGSGAGFFASDHDNIIAIGTQAGPTNIDQAASNRLYLDVTRTDNPLIYGEFDNDLIRINGTLQLGGQDYYRGGDDGVIKSPADSTSDLFLVANDAVIVEIGAVSTQAGTFEIWNGAPKGLNSIANPLFRVDEQGNITNAGTINGMSDVNQKEQFNKIEVSNILTKIASLPISEWQYKSSPDRHIGPMAQDFYAAFGLGQGETTIATVDADGVALAAIQALVTENQKLREEDVTSEEKMRQLEKRLVKLEKLIAESKE